MTNGELIINRARWAVVNGLVIAAILSFAACGSPPPEMGQRTEASSPASPSPTAAPSPEPAPTPRPTTDPARWRLGTERCPMPPHVTVPAKGVEQGDATKGFCVAWANDYPDELGFRVAVAYEGGEVFTHPVAPDEHDFVFPAEEAPVLTGPQCTSRRSFTITVVVVRPGSEEPVGATAAVAECGGG